MSRYAKEKGVVHRQMARKANPRGVVVVKVPLDIAELVADAIETGAAEGAKDYLRVISIAQILRLDLKKKTESKGA